MRDAAFGNAGTIVTFRIGAEDAEFLEKEFLPEFMAADLVNLSKYNIYLKLMVNGMASRPFSAITLVPPEIPKENSREKIIRVAQEKYAEEKQIIDEKIQKWLGDVENAVAPAKSSQPSAGPVLYDAQCALCKKWTKVVFPPDGRRPVYCKSCLKKVEEERKGIKLENIKNSQPTPFSSPRPVRKQVNVEELKNVLGEALGKINPNEK